MSGVWIVEERYSWKQPITGEFLTSKQCVGKYDTKVEASKVASSGTDRSVRFHEYDDVDLFEPFKFSEWLEYQP